MAAILEREEGMDFWKSHFDNSPATNAQEARAPTEPARPCLAESVSPRRREPAILSKIAAPGWTPGGGQRATPVRHGAQRACGVHEVHTPAAAATQRDTVKQRLLLTRRHAAEGARLARGVLLPAAARVDAVCAPVIYACVSTQTSLRRVSEAVLPTACFIHAARRRARADRLACMCGARGRRRLCAQRCDALTAQRYRTGHRAGARAGGCAVALAPAALRSRAQRAPAATPRQRALAGAAVVSAAARTHALASRALACSPATPAACACLRWRTTLARAMRAMRALDAGAVSLLQRGSW
jgi:hypothetical protein